MAIQNAVLLIADISGYTRFMTIHRLNLAHAQEQIARLLEAVIDHAAPFRLAKLEGDAAFLYTGAENLEALGPCIERIRKAFLVRQQQLILDRWCGCESCTQLELLSLKFVAHAGEVALQKIKRQTELAGVNVILVHRMLKNEVPLSEYVLTTEQGLPGIAPQHRAQAQPLDHDFEGLGATRTHYIDLQPWPRPSPEDAAPRSFLRKVWEKLRLESITLPYLMRIKKPRNRFAAH